MKLKDIKAVYFIGAGGIGMSAIARYFMHKGMVVAGYDKTPTELYGISGIPTLIIFSPDGTIAARGHFDRDELIAEVEKALAAAKEAE